MELSKITSLENWSFKGGKMKKVQSLAGERKDPLEQRIKIYYCMELF